MIGMDSMERRPNLRYTQDYFTPGVCCLIKPAAFAKLESFHAQIHMTML